MLVADRNRGPAGKQRGPVDAHSLAVALGSEVRRVRQAEGPGAVVIVVITDRTREMAAGEDIRTRRHSAGIGERLIIRVGLRLVVIGSNVEVDEVGVVVVAVEATAK